MRNRTTSRQEAIFPVTVDDWRAARHGEDPADSRNDAQSVGQALDTEDVDLVPTLNTRALYKR